MPTRFSLPAVAAVAATAVADLVAIPVPHSERERKRKKHAYGQIKKGLKGSIMIKRSMPNTQVPPDISADNLISTGDKSISLRSNPDTINQSTLS